jgi:hypothetical protein
MHRHPVAITDPDHLARARRAAAAMIACVALAYATIVVGFFHALPMTTRIYAPMPFVIGFWIVLTRFLKSFRLPRHAYPLLPHPHPLILFVCLALITVTPFVGILAHPFLPTTAYIGMITAPLVAAGCTAAAYGLFGSRITDPACPKCAYPIAGLDLPTPCPECAHPLEPAHAARHAAIRTTRPGVVWSGGAAIAAGLLAAFVIRNAPAAFYAAVPDPLHRLLASIDAEALRALNTNALTPAQRALLADRVLDARADRDDPIEVSDQLDWVAGEIALGRLGRDQTDRYAFEGFTLRIIHDAPVRAGEPFRVSIAGNPPYYSPQGPRVSYFFAGFTTDAGDAIAREARDFPLYMFDSSLEHRDRSAESRVEKNITPLPFPTHTLTIDRPTRVRARIVLCVLPWTTIPTITWHDDGTYTITPEPITTHELTAEATLTIEP